MSQAISQLPCPVMFIMGHHTRAESAAVSTNRNGYKVLDDVVRLSLTLCSPMDCSTPGLPVLHHLPELMLFILSIV